MTEAAIARSFQHLAPS
jgi:hypothetical protein